LDREQARARLNSDEARLQEALARRSQDDALIQAWVNSMVIESMSDGILVIDRRYTVHAANPAAYQMLGSGQIAARPVFNLNDDPHWKQLVQLTEQTFSHGAISPKEITLVWANEVEIHLRVRTERTPSLSGERRSLCVMFMQDIRELQAQLRTEKLAAMGRMSAAVAHEIRNPLSAIVQANSLLIEDLTDPGAQRLTSIIGQNAKRLGHIVDDILDLARVRVEGASNQIECMPLDEATQRACSEWAHQHTVGQRLIVKLQAPGAQAQFSAEHLRSMLVNLLDNAARYASQRPGAIRVETDNRDGPPMVLVWSDGAPLEMSVQRHLFEPFFSSESRSSGLGLYICRELCERHGAVIAYQRTASKRDGEIVDGNVFYVTFRRALAGVSGSVGIDNFGGKSQGQVGEPPNLSGA
jgi:two-component system sensor histidine kinase PilS (NtrC family)